MEEEEKVAAIVLKQDGQQIMMLNCIYFVSSKILLVYNSTKSR